MSTLRFQGAIFDVDDTILDNKPGQGVYGGLHEQSRFEAALTVGRELGIPQLLDITPKENFDAFAQATVHSMEGAVWNLLHMKGLVDSSVVNYEHELLQKIVQKKNDIHRTVILKDGEEVPGASDFIRSLHSAGLEGKIAIASTGIFRDISAFLHKYNLEHVIPEQRIKSKESFTHPKPHPEVFELAFSTLGLDEADKLHVVAFEDDPRGIMSAVAAGLTVCAITRRYDRALLEALEVPPTFIIDTFDEAYEIVGLEK